MAINPNIITKSIVLVLFLLFGGFAKINGITLDDLQLNFDKKYNNLLLSPELNRFNLKGYGLKGNVYKVVTITHPFHIEYGDTIFTETLKLDSLIFDENRNIKEKYVFKLGHVFENEEKTNLTYYKINGDSIFVFNRNNNNRMELFVINYNENGKLIESKWDEQYKYEPLNPHKQQVFKYNPTGYTSEFWLNSSRKIDITRNGNIIKFKEETSQFNTDYITIYLNNDLPTKLVAESSMMKWGATRLYKYNDNHDLVKHSRLENGKEVVIESYSYEYDSEGNWIKRKRYDENGNLRNIRIREITYNTPEEIREIETNKKTKKVKELENKLKQFAKSHIEDLKRNVATYAKNHKENNHPLKSFSVKDDKYTFNLNDSVIFKNIVFDNRPVLHEGYFFTDSTSTFYLFMEETYYGPEWYLIVIENMKPINWLDFYYSNYAEWDRPEDSEIHEKVRNLINKEYLVYEHKYTEFFRTNIYKLEDAYENGFASPKIAIKIREQDNIKEGRINREIDSTLYKYLKAFILCKPYLGLTRLVEASLNFIDNKILQSIPPSHNNLKEIYAKNFKFENNGFTIVFDDKTKFENVKFKSIPIPKRNSPFYSWAREIEGNVFISESGDLMLIRGSSMNGFIVNLAGNNINIIKEKDWKKYNL